MPIYFLIPDWWEEKKVEDTYIIWCRKFLWCSHQYRQLQISRLCKDWKSVPTVQQANAFSRKVQRYYMMHSPLPFRQRTPPFGDIFVSRARILVYWGKHSTMQASLPVVGVPEDRWRRSTGRTSEGWLLFYHGVSGTCNGYVCPSAEHCGYWQTLPLWLSLSLLTPEEWALERGFCVPNVCFPYFTIMIPRAAGSPLHYYGAAGICRTAFTAMGK